MFEHVTDNNLFYSRYYEKIKLQEKYRCALYFVAQKRKADVPGGNDRTIKSLRGHYAYFECEDEKIQSTKVALQLICNGIALLM